LIDLNIITQNPSNQVMKHKELRMMTSTINPVDVTLLAQERGDCSIMVRNWGTR